MSELTPTPNPEASLYGEEPQPEPVQKAPGLWEQLMGVFSEPVQLFTRLNRTPSWGWALGASLVMALVLVIVWGLNVDADSFLRQMLESNPRVPADRLDDIIEMQKKFLIPGGIINVMIIMPGAVLLLALFYWLIGMFSAEGNAPSYRQSLSLATVPGLVLLPQQLGMAAMSILKSPVSVAPDRLSPFSLGYYLTVENPKLQAVLSALDAFNLAYFALAFLAARHLTRLKPFGAALCTALLVLFSVGFRIVFAN